MWTLLHWRYSRPAGHNNPLPHALGWLFLSREVGADKPLWLLPTLPVLWFCSSHLKLLYCVAQKDVVPQQLRLFMHKTKPESCGIHKDSRKGKKQVPPNAKLDKSIIFCLFALPMALEIIKILLLEKDFNCVCDLMKCYPYLSHLFLTSWLFVSFLMHYQEWGLVQSSHFVHKIKTNAIRKWQRRN